MTTIQTTDASDHDEFEPAPPDKLHAHYCRQLSAMMDGELSPDEAKFMLRRLEHDTALAGCWERWQVCGDVLRGRRHALLPADFAQRVALAIADDGRASVAMSAGTKSRPRFARWGGGAALAASVAVVAFLVARQLPNDAGSAPETPPTIVAQTPATPAPAPVETAPRTTTETPPATGTGAALAATALAAAEVPRRASERRARAQGQRNADRVQAQARDVQTRDVAASTPMVAAAELPALVDVPATETAPIATAPDPFAAPHIAPTRPWPRAILRGYPADSAFSAGYGESAPPARFAPFAPTTLVPRFDAGQVVVPMSPQRADPDNADSNRTDSGNPDPAAEARDATGPH